MKKDDEKEVNILYQNDGNGLKLELRIININKDISWIIIHKELDLAKWNTNNLTIIKYLLKAISKVQIILEII